MPDIMKTELKSRKTIQERKEKHASELPRLEQQFRIASLIDNNKKEDPKLKEKLKQISEATQKSLDEAYIALHDCDYDVNRAVNKLLEGEDTEWSTLSKKKKPKSLEVKERQERENTGESTATDNNNNCNDGNQLLSKPGVGGRGGGYSRGRGRGVRSQGKSVLREPNGSPARRVFTNSNLETKTLEMIEASRTERVKTPVIRPLDTWDPNRPVSNLMTKGSRNDVEDEEYTGSLSNGLVITSSNFGKYPNCANVGNKNVADVTSRKSSVADVAPAKFPSMDLESISKPGFEDKESDEKCLLKDQTDDKLKIDNHSVPASLESSYQMNDTLGKPNLGPMRAPPMTASLMKAPPRTDKSPLCRTRSSSVPDSTRPSVSSKIPLTAVEMPPDSDSSVELLDITFGAIDLEENLYDAFVKTDSSSELLFCQSKPPGSSKQSFKNTKERSSVENLSFVKDLKMDSTLYMSPMRQNSYPKVTQKSKSFHNSPVTSDFNPTSAVSASNIPVQLNVSGAQKVPFTQISYNLNSKNTQPLSYYHNVLGGQTYTSNSQYGATGLSSSYSVPYQSYSSMVQGHTRKGQTVPPSFSNDLDAIAASTVNSMTFPGVTASKFSIPLSTVEHAVNNNSSQASSHGKTLPAVQPNVVAPPHQVILGQAGVAYFQAPLYFQDMKVMQQQRTAPPQISPGYYDVHYPAAPRSCEAGSYPMSHQPLHPDKVATMGYSDVTSSAQYPGMCITPTDSMRDNCKPPFQMPVNQLIYASGKPGSSNSQTGPYN